MIQVSDIKTVDNNCLIDFFRCKVEGMSGTSAMSYSKAVSCLRNYISYVGTDKPFDSNAFIEGWFVFMFFQGLSFKTAMHYFEIAAGLYGTAVKENLVPAPEFLSVCKGRIKVLGPELWVSLISEEKLKQFVSILRFPAKFENVSSLAVDMMLFWLMNINLSLREIVELKREQIPDFAEDSRAIAMRWSDTKRKYIFPLEQGRRTPRQAEAAAAALILTIFTTAGIRPVAGLHDIVKSCWMLVAMRCGLSAQKALDIIGNPPQGIPVLNLLSDASRQNVINDSEVSKAVERVLVSNSENWFAMRLRTGVKFDRLIKRLEEISSKIIVPEIFYPSNEIAKRVNKKLVYESKPVIPDIVFFKSKITNIQPLFANIGDLAWCYSTGGVYNRISKKSMEEFQRAIGQFSPDFEVGPVGSIPLREGDRVVVVGGPFIGKEGEVVEETYSENNVVYRIMLWGDNNNIEWRVKDSRFVKKQQ